MYRKKYSQLRQSSLIGFKPKNAHLMVRRQLILQEVSRRFPLLFAASQDSDVPLTDLTPGVGKKPTYTETLSLVFQQNQILMAEIKRIAEKMGSDSSQKSELTKSVIELTKAITIGLNYVLSFDETSDTEVKGEEVLAAFNKISETFANWIQMVALASNGDTYSEKALGKVLLSFNTIEKLLERAGQAGELAVSNFATVLQNQVGPALQQLNESAQFIQTLLEMSLEQSLEDKDLETNPKKEQLLGKLEELKALKLPSSLTEQSTTFKTQSSKKMNFTNLGISENDLLRLKKDYLPVLYKMKAGQSLTTLERNLLKQIDIAELAILVGQDETNSFSGPFLAPKSSVIKVILTLKDTSMLRETPVYLDAESEGLHHVAFKKEFLNPVELKTELYFTVIKNNGTLSLEEIFKKIHQTFFSEGLAHMMNTSVFLESIQLQTVFPISEKYSLAQRAYSTPGLRSQANFTTCSRPFTYVLDPAFLTGSRNAFLVRFHGICSYFGQSNLLDGLTAQNTIYRMQNVLRDNLVIGPNMDVILRLCIKTRRTESPFPYIPVGEISIGGFIVNGNPQNKNASVFPQLSDRPKVVPQISDFTDSKTVAASAQALESPKTKKTEVPAQVAQVSENGEA